MSSRPRLFVTARHAAELLGVSEAVVVADIERGFSKIDSLRGGEYGDTWVVYAEELEGERLDVHCERLRAAHREDVANG